MKIFYSFFADSATSWSRRDWREQKIERILKKKKKNIFLFLFFFKAANNLDVYGSVITTTLVTRKKEEKKNIKTKLLKINLKLSVLSFWQENGIKELKIDVFTFAIRDFYVPLPLKKKKKKRAESLIDFSYFFFFFSLFESMDPPPGDSDIFHEHIIIEIARLGGWSSFVPQNVTPG